MDLKDQVVNLELSKKLKKLKIKQESLWYYNSKTMKLQRGFTSHADIEGFCRWSISAFTTSELGEMLPYHKIIENIVTYKEPSSNEMVVELWLDMARGKYSTFIANTEANARAKMLIYLIEHKLMGAK